MNLQVDQSKCNGCSVCFDVCPVGAIEVIRDKAIIFEDVCIGCSACIEACVANAIFIKENVNAVGVCHE